jgi:hypothetical protein
MIMPDILPCVRYIFFDFPFISQHVPELHNAVPSTILPLLLWENYYFVVGTLGELVASVIDTF